MAGKITKILGFFAIFLIKFGVAHAQISQLPTTAKVLIDERLANESRVMPPKFAVSLGKLNVSPNFAENIELTFAIVIHRPTDLSYIPDNPDEPVVKLNRPIE